ncbi:hypothetical protein GF420_06140 [candidate division GN15 bacterium]|nr:hypothetical protein [candidate division GN15 bacterium]
MRLSTVFAIVFAITALLAAMTIWGCSGDDPVSQTESAEAGFDWVILDNVDPANLTGLSGQLAMFAPTQRQVMLADSIAVVQLATDHPELSEKLPTLFRQFIGVTIDNEPTILVNYIDPPEDLPSNDARTGAEYWQEVLVTFEDGLAFWIQVAVSLESLEPHTVQGHFSE